MEAGGFEQPGAPGRPGLHRSSRMLQRCRPRTRRCARAAPMVPSVPMPSPVTTGAYPPPPPVPIPAPISGGVGTSRCTAEPTERGKLPHSGSAWIGDRGGEAGLCESPPSCYGQPRCETAGPTSTSSTTQGGQHWSEQRNGDRPEQRSGGWSEQCNGGWSEQCATEAGPVVSGFGRIMPPPACPNERNLAKGNVASATTSSGTTRGTLKGQCPEDNSIGHPGRLPANLPDPPPPREPAKRTAAESCVGMSVGRCSPFAVAAPLQDDDMNDEPNTQELHEPGRPGDPATQLSCRPRSVVCRPCCVSREQEGP